MAIKAWIYRVGGNREQTADEVVELLVKQGIEVHDFDIYISRGPGVFFCNEGTFDICRQLLDLGRNGQIQVLVCCSTNIPGDAVWRLMEAGASDVIVNTDSNTAASEISSRLRRWNTVEEIVDSPLVKEVLVGESQPLKAILRQVVEVANFTDISMLILGESGTGKEVLANLVHALDARKDKGGLVILDCSSIMPELSGSEFFGHERGAFTDAVSSREGVFALADGGTLFLDEVGRIQ